MIKINNIRTNNLSKSRGDLRYRSTYILNLEEENGHGFYGIKELYITGYIDFGYIKKTKISKEWVEFAAEQLKNHMINNMKIYD